MDDDCPETHFQCLDNGYCLPIFLRCNDVYDCPGKEDEGGCDDYTCPGYYRCRGSMVCLHPFYVCDGNLQCPQKDDELLCGMSCPQHCVCHGLAFTCTQHFAAAVFPGMRYLDASGSGMTPAHLTNNRMLVHMDLSHCGLSTVGMLQFPNLISMDLSDNVLIDINIRQLYQSSNLRLLTLSNNPITSLLVQHPQDPLVLPSLEYLDISNVTATELDTDIFEQFANVRTINMSVSGLQFLGSNFPVLKSLRVLDLHGCPVKLFSPEIFKGLNKLHLLYVDNYKLCCPHGLPDDFNINHCHGPKDTLSSCDSLIASTLYRALFALLTVFGMLSHILIMFWILFAKDKLMLQFHTLLVHMTGCDLFMGVHTAIVTIADQLYRGHYVWKDTAWRHSVMCQVSSFVFFLSTDMSAFLTCLMTLDRCAALRCPHRPVRVTTRASHVCCLAVWAGCVVLAAVSLTPHPSQGGKPHQTGMCQPLTELLTDPSNHDYTLGALVVLTFLLQTITCVGQIYAATVTGQRASLVALIHSQQTESEEVTVSRRVFRLIMFDVLCFLWSGVVMGLMTAGISTPSNLQVATSLLAMPLKSALNPCMYLAGYLKERRRKMLQERLFQRLGVIITSVAR